jgi:flavin reductase (DIM6/NTAB) family NADH-FMN oxidoreductase RutF
MGMTAMSKVDTEYLEYLWPMRHYLVTCGDEERPNIIALGFCMPVSKEPPMVACAIGRKTYSTGLIRKTGEYVINVPTKGLERQVYYCGYHSGRDVDKFEQTGLTPRPARHLATPIIQECIAHMECRLEREVDSGDKILFIATVIEAYADEDVVKGHRRPEYAAGSYPEKVYGGRFKHPDNTTTGQSTEGSE